MTYAFDPQTRVWSRAGSSPAYDYSDGDDVEQRIARVVEAAEDLAVGSAELAAAIDDWASAYHLSPRRADVLRPVAGLLEGRRVLEVGAGCGAITRYLGEVAGSVVAVEGSARRARIAASRVRDLDGVAVHVDTLADLDVPGGFDVVTLIGVLEYSRLYARSKDPVGDTLERCRALLAPGGLLVVAIENQLGLKYLAGAPEDHLGRPFVGVEDSYDPDGPVTFGRRDLEARVRTAGFSAVEFLYPFPDYKHPRAIITEAGLLTASEQVVDVLRSSGAPTQSRGYERVMSEEAAWEVVARNGLAAALANSFLVVAGNGRAPGLSDGHVLTVYATDRRRHLAKQTQLRHDENGLRAVRSRIYPDAPAPAAGYTMTLRDEVVEPGRLLLRDLQGLLNRPGWSTADLVSWAGPWVELLDARASGDGTLPVDHVDCTPSNILRRSDGSLLPFDLEWVASERPRRSFVLVRGLYTSLLSMRSVAAPAPGVLGLVAELVRAVAVQLEVEDAEVDRAFETEASFQAVVNGRPAAANLKDLLAPGLDVRSGDLSADRDAAASEVERLRREAARLRLTLEETRIRSEERAGAAQRELEQTRTQAVVAGHQAAAARHEVDVMRGSTSWRLSAPVRALGPVRAAVQGPTPQRWSLRSKDNWRVLARSVRQRGLFGTVRRLQADPNSSPPAADDYGHWVATYDTLAEADRVAATAWIDALPARPSFAVVVPVHAPRAQDLRRAVASVVGQLYPEWQLVLVDDASPDRGATRALLRELSHEHEQIHVLELERNLGIAAATNAGLAAVEADYVAFLDHDDELRPHSLALVAAELVAYPDTDVVYTDEDKIDDAGVRYEPYFKPGPNPELLLAQNYFNHLTVVRTDLLRKVGGLRAGLEGAQDHDLVLRLVAAIGLQRVRHVPHVLYHWRQYTGGSSFSRDQMERSAAAGRRAVQEHLATQGTQVSVSPHPLVPLWHLPDFAAAASTPPVTAVIPTRDRVELLQGCVEGLLHRTDYPDLRILVVDNDSTDQETLDYLAALERLPAVTVLRAPGPFNYSALNNRAVDLVTTPLVLLLNNDIEVLEPGWLREMTALLERPGAGAVGAKLYYGNGTVQHAGVVLGIGGVAGHAHKRAARASTGYFGRLALTQEVGAVTGACLLTPRALYLEVGGLDEQALRVAFNDVDFCLKLRQAGHRILWSASAELLHLESVSRGAETTPAKVARFNREIEIMQSRWGAALTDDSAYNPNLTDVREDYTLAAPPRVAWPW